MFVFVTVGVGIAAVNTGNNLLYLMLGLLISILLVSMVLSEVVLFGLRIRRTLPTRCTAGQPAVVTLTVENRKRWLPSYALEVRDDDLDLPHGGGQVHLLKVAPGATVEGRYHMVFPRRGHYGLRFVRVVSRYPFGLVEKVYRHRVPGDLLVYPAERAAPSPPARGHSPGLDAPSQQIGNGTEIAGLRDYQDGDDARSVHALRSAALGRWVVRQREQDVHQTLTISLDTRAPAVPDAAFEEAFEHMIERAAFLSRHGLSRGTAVRVASSQGHSPWVTPGRSLDPVLAYLADLTTTDSNTLPQAQSSPTVHLSPENAL